MLFADFEDESMSPTEQADMDALMEALYTRRNVDMAASIAEFTSGQPGRYFIVVGSAHLLGEESVITHLQNAGFSITPVRLAP